MTQPAAAAEVYAGFWIRLWAAIVDSLLWAVFAVPVLWAAYGPQAFQSDKFIEGPVDFLVSNVFPAVATILFWVYKEATPGKMAVHARVVDARTGGHPSTGQYIGRYFAYFLSLLPLGLGFLWVAWDGRKQGWHDKLAATVVVRRRRNASELATFETSA
ncbi:MAG: RDD family protein [Gemmatimonadaceae bacterium]